MSKIFVSLRFLAKIPLLNHNMDAIILLNITFVANVYDLPFNLPFSASINHAYPKKYLLVNSLYPDYHFSAYQVKVQPNTTECNLSQVNEILMVNKFHLPLIF